MGKYGTSIFHGYTLDDLHHDVETNRDFLKNRKPSP